jgi:zinc protease
LILHDWSGFISLKDSAIAKERGVIREEWRTRQDAQTRIWEQQFPKIYPNNKYAYRMPIGSIDVIENFKPDELRAYYKKWYRPDLQAIIIVGDINVDSVEVAVKNIFADIPAPVNPAVRESITVEDNIEPIVSIATDKEAPRIILNISYKHDKMPADAYASVQGIAKDYLSSVVSTILSERLDELTHKSNPPFIAASASDGEFMVSKTKEAFSIAALVKEGDIKRALDTLVVEAQRMKQFGFTQGEYDRARANILKQYETNYNDRDKQKNSSYTREYVEHFTNGGYIPGIEVEYNLINQIAPAIQLSQVNEYAKEFITDNNVVITLTGPEKEGLKYPTEAQLLNDFLAAQSIPVTAYKETVSNEPLIPTLPAPGKIVSETTDPLYGATILTLGNGVKVVLKHTDFKKDQIIMTASGLGGSSYFGDEQIYNLKVFNDVISLGGLGEFSAIELNKKLAGKTVSCKPSLSIAGENINGGAVPADIKSLFELIYLTVTAPRADEEAYASFETRMISQLENLELNPMYAFSDSVTTAIYSGNIRASKLTPADFQRISYPEILKMYKEVFGYVDGFVFTFVGNLSVDSMKPLVEQYIATLPTRGKALEKNINNVPEMRKGTYTNIFKRQLEIPKASVVDMISGHVDYNQENMISAMMMKQCLDLVYYENIREAEGGTYGVSTSASINWFPEGETYLQIYFDTDPAKREKMNTIVFDELKNMANEGPRAEDFKKSKNNMIKRHAERVQENAYWLTVLDLYYTRGFDSYTKYLETVEALTPSKVQEFTKKLTEQGNRIEVVMEP